MNKEEIEIFYPASQAEWRLWLQNNHNSKQSVWLVFYKQKTGKPTLTWSEAVDEVLCFGWIDSKKVSIDEEKSHQFFSKRKEKSTWSKINKEKTENLIEQGLMKQAGFEIIATAKQNGSWTILDEVEELIIPEDFHKALKNKPNAMDFFFKFE